MKFVGAVHTDLPISSPGAAPDRPRAGMDRLNAEADIDAIPAHADLAGNP